MQAYQRWKRIRPVASDLVGVSTNCSATTETATVSLTLRRDSYGSTGEWSNSETFRIDGTPAEMESLGKKLTDMAANARNLLRRNQDIDDEKASQP